MIKKLIQKIKLFNSLAEHRSTILDKCPKIYDEVVINNHILLRVSTSFNVIDMNYDLLGVMKYLNHDSEYIEICNYDLFNVRGTAGTTPPSLYIKRNEEGSFVIGGLSDPSIGTLVLTDNKDDYFNYSLIQNLNLEFEDTIELISVLNEVKCMYTIDLRY